MAPRDPWLDSKWVYAHVVERTDPAMPVLTWEPPAPAEPSRSGTLPSLLQRPDKPRDGHPRG